MPTVSAPVPPLAACKGFKLPVYLFSQGASCDSYVSLIEALQEDVTSLRHEANNREWLREDAARKLRALESVSAERLAEIEHLEIALEQERATVSQQTEEIKAAREAGFQHFGSAVQLKAFCKDLEKELREERAKTIADRLEAIFGPVVRVEICGEDNVLGPSGAYQAAQEQGFVLTRMEYTGNDCTTRGCTYILGRLRTVNLGV